MFRADVVKSFAVNVSAYKSPVLNVLVTTVLMFIYPPKSASIFPDRRIVEAAIEDVWNFTVDTAFEKVAVFANTLDMVKLPLGFVIAAELRRKRDALFAVIVLYTVRLLVCIPFDAVRFKVLIPGAVNVSEKRRSAPLYVIYFSWKEIELRTCRVLVV